MPKPHPLKGPNRFKLGVFSTNADGGLAITTVPERWGASWDDNLNAVGIADRAGLEFFLPIARWRGFGGKDRGARMVVRDLHLGGGPRRIDAADRPLHDRCTCPILHPLMPRRRSRPVDHISQGRAGTQHRLRLESERVRHVRRRLGSDAYGQAAEWIEVIERAYRLRRAVRP
jgi:hypothetical protein